MNKRKWIIGLVVLAFLAAVIIWGRHRIHFDFTQFGNQIAASNWRKILLGLACIYAGYLLRSMRWALLIRHNKRVPLLSLVGTQVMGFTAVALIGRVADLVRPYLVARKTNLELSSQVAVYIVERLFDFGAMGLIFSLAILQVPQGDVVTAISHSRHLAALSGNHPGAAAFLFRYGGLILTACGALFLVGIRLIGETVAVATEHSVGLVSKKLGISMGHKIRVFRTGLDTIHSWTDFAAAASISLVMWVLIATAYLETMQAFTGSRPLASMTASKAVMLMVLSGGASVLQLPIIGWFSQIGIVAAAIVAFFHASPEASTACAATLLLVTFLGIVPIGLTWAQLENVSLRGITAESEQAGGGLAEGARVGD